MNGALTKLHDGPILTDAPVEAKYFGEDGSPLTGIFVRDSGPLQTKMIISGGDARFGWTYKKIEGAIYSPLVNDLNLYCCRSAFTWVEDGRPQDAERFSILRVCRKAKPFGSCLVPRNQSLDDLRALSAESGLMVALYDYPDHGFHQLFVALPGGFSDHFDLAAFEVEWQRHVEATPAEWLFSRGVLHALVETMAHQRLTDHFGDDFNQPRSQEELIVSGLLLGYPLETTAAVVIDPAHYGFGFTNDSSNPAKS
jgi:hypothetical protein